MVPIILPEIEETGLKIIDDQHLEISIIVNHICELNNKNSDVTVISEQFEKLLPVIKAHFVTEEELMLKNSFENYYSHKLEHDRCIRKIIEFKGNIYSIENCIPDFLNFITNWLPNHLMFKDIRLANFILRKADINK